MTVMAIKVTVAYSPRPREVLERHLALPEGATVAQAVEICGWTQAVQHADDGAPLLGIWGRKALPEQPLRDQDRVEIYRPLTVDPKVARRARFVKQGARASGLFARRRPGAKAGY